VGLIEPALESRPDLAARSHRPISPPDLANDPPLYLRTGKGVIERALTVGAPLPRCVSWARAVDLDDIGRAGYRHAEREIGWFEIHFVNGASDPVFAGLQQSGTGVSVAQATHSTWRPARNCWHGRTAPAGL
jgi:hypothetical protein